MSEIIGDEKPEVFQNKSGAADKWTFLRQPQKDKPHYVNLKLEGCEAEFYASWSH